MQDVLYVIFRCALPESSSYERNQSNPSNPPRPDVISLSALPSVEETAREVGNVGHNKINRRALEPLDFEHVWNIKPDAPSAG
jgi:hypothetical protein